MEEGCDLDYVRIVFENALGASRKDDDDSMSSPYHQVMLICSFWVILTFVVSTVSRNYSQVDKLWSITPFLYTWTTVVDRRTLLMAVLATIWGIRLTFNFYRRGGYSWPPWSGDEDYRWKVIQDGEFVSILTNPVAWVVFNFGFISLYQNVLLLLIATPSLVAYTVAKQCPSAYQALNWMDFLAAVSFLLFVTIESVADNQQYKFQTEKHRRTKQGDPLTGDYALGFCRSGLFSVLRKPNYAAEQAIWTCFYIFSIAASQRVWNWSGTGFILLIMLFQSSGWFTEKITLKKYPHYKDYMEDVPLYLPVNLFRSSRGKKTKTA